MSKAARAIMGVASLAMVALFFVPLWRIMLTAPQYPEGLGMLIRLTTVTGMKPNDLGNINGLNHYIGMKTIAPDAIPELRFMPWIVGVLIVAGLVVAAAGRRGLLVGWVSALGGLLVVGLVDFWRWEYDYGHNLDTATAIIKIPDMTYQPPLIGTKQLLNFTASSWPDIGAVLLGAVFLAGIAAIYLSRRAEASERVSALAVRRSPAVSAASVRG